jgi:hypothetical protein
VIDEKVSNQKSKIITALIANFFLVSASFFPLAALAAYTYNPMEPIPGFGAVSDFPTYILNIYKFGIWTVGIAALLMISIGGFMYFTSAGNTAKLGQAKKVIFDALFGLIVALAAWLLLYVINPDLVKVSIKIVPVAEQEKKAALEYTGKYPEITAKMPVNCNDSKWQSIFTKVSSEKGIDKCVLQATAAKESGCNQVAPRTNGGRDCSVMQINAQGICGTTCEDLEQNPEKAVSCAAGYLNSCSSKWRRDPTELWIRDYYAGYNGGCGALNISASCTGMTNQYGKPYLKWDCPKDCGGYCPVPARTSTFLTYYMQCKGS